jgi:hypothetical protein
MALLVFLSPIFAVSEFLAGDDPTPLIVPAIISLAIWGLIGLAFYII